MMKNKECIPEDCSFCYYYQQEYWYIPERSDSSRNSILLLFQLPKLLRKALPLHLVHFWITNIVPSSSKLLLLFGLRFTGFFRSYPRYSGSTFCMILWSKRLIEDYLSPNSLISFLSWILFFLGSTKFSLVCWGKELNYFLSSIRTFSLKNRSSRFIDILTALPRFKKK